MSVPAPVVPVGASGFTLAAHGSEVEASLFGGGGPPLELPLGAPPPGLPPPGPATGSPFGPTHTP
jgi:hypothetical protein